METYLQVRASQIRLYKEVPLYYQTKDDEYLLYKKAGDTLDSPRVDEEKFPHLFIAEADKEKAVKELLTRMNKRLAEQILSADLAGVRKTLTLVVREALEDPVDDTFKAVPETIEIFFEGFSKRSELLDALLKIQSSSSEVVRHTINVLIFTFRYGFYHGLEERQVKRLALAALFHDIGKSALDRKILEKKGRLTDMEYQVYTTHTSRGCDLLLKQPGFDPLAASVALEHHERIDGSGYPYGRTNPCFESQLIGLIDCYEPLTYLEKTHRKPRRPFESLRLIKDEVIHGRFRPDIFKDFSKCLTEKKS